jgi:hypothetical protein
MLPYCFDAGLKEVIDIIMFFHLNHSLRCAYVSSSSYDPELDFLLRPNLCWRTQTSLYLKQSHLYAQLCVNRYQDVRLVCRKSFLLQS